MDLQLLFRKACFFTTFMCTFKRSLSGVESHMHQQARSIVESLSTIRMLTCVYHLNGVFEVASGLHTSFSSVKLLVTLHVPFIMECFPTAHVSTFKGSVVSVISHMNLKMTEISKCFLATDIIAPVRFFTGVGHDVIFESGCVIKTTCARSTCILIFISGVPVHVHSTLSTLGFPFFGHI